MILDNTCLTSEEHQQTDPQRGALSGFSNTLGLRNLPSGTQSDVPSSDSLFLERNL